MRKRNAMSKERPRKANKKSLMQGKGRPPRGEAGVRALDGDPERETTTGRGRLARRWITLGSIASLVGITGIVSTTKDGFDFIRDYIFSHSEVSKSATDLEDGRSRSESPRRPERIRALPYGGKKQSFQSSDELIKILEYRAPRIADSISDPVVREKFIALHSRNVGALRSGDIVLSHEITNDIHAALLSWEQLQDERYAEEHKGKPVIIEYYENHISLEYIVHLRYPNLVLTNNDKLPSERHNQRLQRTADAAR
jgi:hypothetical protein